jgi:hypothetical protein
MGNCNSSEQEDFELKYRINENIDLAKQEEEFAKKQAQDYLDQEYFAKSSNLLSNFENSPKLPPSDYGEPIKDNVQRELREIQRISDNSQYFGFWYISFVWPNIIKEFRN